MKLSMVLITALVLLLSRSLPAEENASNPLAAVSNLDLRFKTYDLEGAGREKLYLDGASMLNPKLKLKYQVY